MTKPTSSERLPAAARIDHAHVTGRHCASTAAANLVRHHNIDWSEAFCFGLGGGMGTWYLQLNGFSPSRIAHGRAENFEQRFFRHLTPNFAWDHGRGRDESERALKQAVAEGRLAIVLVNIRDIPYLDDVHFPGHAICPFAYDDHEGVFWVSDMGRRELQPIPYAAMAKARVSKLPPLTHDGHFFAPAQLHVPADLPAAVCAAIVENAERLLDRSVQHRGMSALEHWQEDLRTWPQLPDWRLCARFAYETIEKRGSGGGNFRLMYSEFLREAAALVPEVASLGLEQQALAAGHAWVALGQALRAVARADQPDFGQVEALLREVIECERNYLQSASSLRTP